MDNPNGRTIGAVVLVGVGLLMAFSLYHRKRLRMLAPLPPGVPIPVLFSRTGSKELKAPVPPGRARKARTARWVWANTDNVLKHVRLANFLRNGIHEENPLERLPAADVPGRGVELIEVPVRSEATKGWYTYDIYVDDRLAKDPEIMIET